MSIRITGAGMKPTLPVAIHRKPSSKPDTGRPSVNTSAAPRATLIMPSVAMNGGRPPKLTSTPLSNPQAMPTASAAEHRHRQRLAALQQRAEHHSRQRHDRADREIDAAGNDHERHARRDDGVDARLLRRC